MNNLIRFILSLLLGGMMIYGSISKFQTPFAVSAEVITKAQIFLDKNDNKHATLVLFVSGMKQTGYMWLLLAICELLFGLLLIFRKTRLVGALLMLLITLNILLFHIFLESDEIGELLVSLALFGTNVYLTLHYAAQKSFLMVK